MQEAPTDHTPQTARITSQHNVLPGEDSGARIFGLYVLVLSLLFCKPLYGLLRLAFSSELYSHIPLIPFIAAYLIWIRRKTEVGAHRSEGRGLGSKGEGRRAEGPARGPTGVFYAVGIALVVIYWLALWKKGHLATSDSLAFTISGYLCFLWGGFLQVFGKNKAKALAFPLAFLVFMVPFPTVVNHGIEMFFQHTSADAANAMLSMTGTPFLRNELVFKLPGIVIQVAEECSGIRSSLVLFITSLVAGHMFLTSPWRKTVLALFVIPLGIIRNGFRITTIALLCAHLDPSWIHSPLHHRGGPLFFAASLVPFFAILVWLRKSELRKQKKLSAPSST
jgi:exosortase C (VPDSG-CTERM-specific)